MAFLSLFILESFIRSFQFIFYSLSCVANIAIATKSDGIEVFIFFILYYRSQISFLFASSPHRMKASEEKTRLLTDESERELFKFGLLNKFNERNDCNITPEPSPNFFYYVFCVARFCVRRFLSTENAK